jgi:hypothetical protein
MVEQRGFVVSDFILLDFLKTALFFETEGVVVGSSVEP